MIMYCYVLRAFQLESCISFCSLFVYEDNTSQEYSTSIDDPSMSVATVYTDKPCGMTCYNMYYIGYICMCGISIWDFVWCKHRLYVCLCYMCAHSCMQYRIGYCVMEKIGETTSIVYLAYNVKPAIKSCTWSIDTQLYNTAGDSMYLNSLENIFGDTVCMYLCVI